LRRFRSSSKIRCLTQAEVEKIEGAPGSFTATIRRRPRFVNTKCTACGACAEVCPVERKNAFNFGLNTTKAAYLPFPTAYPMQFVIDSEVCRGSECSECVKVCDYDAIDLTDSESTITEEIDSVILATGWSPFDASRLEYLSYVKLPNVISNVEMERMAAAEGPTTGKIVRPSNGTEIDSVAFIQCAGSRDENYQKHCSGVCCMGSLKQIRYVREQYPDALVYVFYIDIRTPGRLEDFYAEVQKDEKVKFIKGKAARIDPGQSEDSVVVVAEDTLSGEKVYKEVDLAVLATGITPNDPGLDGWIRRDEDGFLILDEASDIFPAGCARRPVDVAESVRDATGAALRALQGVRN
jgi:quinone-modifying oxidoreductase subunit QmoA